MVVFEALEGEYSETVAFTGSEDRRGKIYLNAKYLKSDSIEELSKTFVHEFSHQADDAVRTLDFWYLYPNDEELSKLVSSGLSHDEAINHAMESRSKRMLFGCALQTDVESGEQEYFIYETQGDDLSGGLNNYNSDSLLRSRMALRNADNVAAFPFI